MQDYKQKIAIITPIKHLGLDKLIKSKGEPFYLENGTKEEVRSFLLNNLIDIINHASKDIFIPVTVGGGIRKIEDAEKLFLNGADKIAINSAAVRKPSLINDLVKNFGSQAVVVSIQAKKIDENKWQSQKSRLGEGRGGLGPRTRESGVQKPPRGGGEGG